MKIANQILSMCEMGYAPQTMHVLHTLRDESTINFFGTYTNPVYLFCTMYEDGDIDATEEDLKEWLGVDNIDAVWGMSPEEFMTHVTDIPEEVGDQLIQRAKDEDEWKGQDGDTRSYFDLVDKKPLKNSTWLVHFSDNVDSIEREGFTKGTDEMDYSELGLTTHKSRKSVGYNFAYDTDDYRDIRNSVGGSHGPPKYGKDCVVFQSSGIKAYHSGDEENQIIFWGPSVKPKLIYPIWNIDNDFWEVGDTEHGVSDRRVRFEYGKINDAIEWVINNHRLIDAVREKRSRKNLHYQRNKGR